MHSSTEVCSVLSHTHFYCHKILFLESVSFNLLKCQREKKAFAALKRRKAHMKLVCFASSLTDIKTPQLFLKFNNITKQVF